MCGYNGWLRIFTVEEIKENTLYLGIISNNTILKINKTSDNWEIDNDVYTYNNKIKVDMKLFYLYFKNI